MKKITICGSMQFLDDMKSLKKFLESRGFEVYIPETEKNSNSLSCVNEIIDYKNKVIDRHLDKIKNSDAVLVANYEKNGIKDYIGGNTFLELGFSYVLDKKIFILNNIPAQNNTIEIQGLKPVCLNGNLDYLDTYLSND